jgi:hypothetical protein
VNALVSALGWGFEIVHLFRVGTKVCVGFTSSACMASYTKFYCLTNMWMSVLCPILKESTFHSLKCLEGSVIAMGLTCSSPT